VATLVTKLQVFIQVYKNTNAIYYYIYISYSKKEINNSIDDTSQQTVQNFPRILREIEVLKQEAFMLKEQMKNVREDLIKVEKNTVNESMKLLLDLDIMRTNILNIQMGLQVNDLF
jgi:conserved oligomeric Golgi complex subunit 7